MDRFVPSEVNTTWVVPHYLPPRQEVQVRAILHITHLVHYRYKHIPPAAGSLVHVTQIMIEPTQYRFYELRSLLGHVVTEVHQYAPARHAIGAKNSIGAPERIGDNRQC